MANLCNNSVVFSGDPTAIENVKALFKEIQDKQDSTGKWFLPPYVTADFSKMQQITVSDEKIDYQTRWLPNLAGLIQIADHHGLKFVNTFSELEHEVFGEAGYENGEYYDIRLDLADLQQVDAYDIAALEKALDRKIQNELYYKTTSNITEEELTAQYGDLPTGTMLLKFATLKNFDKAKEIFGTWDEETIVIMDNSLNADFHHIMELNFTRDEYIAMCFLKSLITDWYTRQQQKTQQNYISR